MVSPRCREILERLYERYYGNIYRYCLRRLFVREAAEDATSVVFLHAAEHIDRFRFDDREDQSADLRNWLYRIATTSVNAMIRKARRRRELLAAAARQGALRSGDVPAQADGDPSVEWPTLYAAILRLKPRQQAIVALRYSEGLATKDIAAILGTTDGAVRVALSRGVGSLRRFLDLPPEQGSRDHHAT